ncbi:hypothetical protein [Kushneria phosphatilytica]|uniref:Uncharacterized protein n=1 Tax=Kushneria phosphatilytica TaxID=657387 RepID=A0A5C1A236_9GAMM|nr:hypothetical protein [Kushneria phosphatilytica]QEL12258.1 hypothetical protein FY550_14675 [Kushneria phosphatilytica]
MATVHAIHQQHDPRDEFLAVRAELHRRTEDLDLIELWDELQPAERQLVLRSAAQHLVPLRPLNEIDPDERTADRIVADLTHCPMEWMRPQAREAIRAAIHRMSTYANRLRDRMEPEGPHPSQTLAASARHALAQGDTAAAMHYLQLIEQTR